MCLWKRKRPLRQLVLEAYGDDFIKLYDAMNRGEVIGNLMFTIDVIEKIEKVKKENEGKWKRR